MTETLDEDKGRPKPLTIDEAIAFVNQRQKTGQITLKTLSDNAGYSKSTWSTVLQGKYGGKPEKVHAALIRFVDDWRAGEALVPITAFRSFRGCSAWLPRIMKWRCSSVNRGRGRLRLPSIMQQRTMGSYTIDAIPP